MRTRRMLVYAVEKEPSPDQRTQPPGLRSTSGRTGVT